MAELNKNHSNQLADLKKGFERADIENEKLNSILTHKFKQSDARVIELTSELERNKAENSEKKFYSQKEDAMIKLNIAESIKVDLEAKIKRIQAENSKQVDELIDLQTENAFLNKQITLLKDIEIKYNLVDLELKKFQNEINNLSQKLEKSSLLNDELEKTSGEVKNENDDLKQRLKRAEDENFNFAKEINAWKYKHQALTDENNLLQSGHNLMQEELNNPKEEKRLANEAAQAKLSGRRANGKPPIAPPTYEIHASNQSLSKAGEDLKAAKDAYLNANEQSSIVEGKLRRMTIDFEQVQKENTDLIETRKQIEDKHKNALKIKQEENEMRCAELDTAYLEKFKQSQEKVYELERKLNDLKTKNADLRKTMRLNNLVDVESETESIESLKVSELDEARIKINELEAHLKKVQEMSDQLGEELNDSYEDNKKLTDTLDALTIEKVNDFFPYKK
jgi:DNA repair exonuclease SbcCD ATPase subunit